MSSSLFPSLNLSPPLHPFSSRVSPSPSPLSTSLYTPTPLQFPSRVKTLGLNQTPDPHRRLIPLSINLTAGNHEDSSRKLEVDGLLDRARHLFDNLPQPVKSFPWATTLENFLRIILDLALVVVKYLSVPVLALTQLSEMSYCAHQRKMIVIPIPFLIGFSVAGVLKDTVVELASDLKEGGFPWHLLLIAMFFTLLKLPGPHYPYWGRLLIPHFANGGLWSSVWLAFMWYKGNQSSSLGHKN